MRIGDLTLREAVKICNSKCEDCPFGDQLNFDWHCVISDIADELNLDKEIEVKNE